MAGTTGRLAAVAAAALTCAAATADAPVATLAGRYGAHFPNALVDGTEYWSDDVVEIVPVDARHAYIRFDLQFYNGHSCSLAGVAEQRGVALVYREPADRVLEGRDRCTLTIARDGEGLGWNDDGSCKSYCGMRGSFLHGDVPWSSRRPIRYIARLKRSQEYATALTEWRTGKTAD